ncbi:hypothetical protein AURDEDRAFT_116916 [Auricularia subglabra TFB-10046 SS5]|uniref:Uncharacterized protein n=1 Tax=Auricularia subglabra (strain TFB-10046 / SS5) TaxID=717982 RepID=J0CZR0_AURST|nr:hypothetical protein AURDEDRAFT_116916 [Auricularia subglabra TFB-10046 SS5]
MSGNATQQPPLDITQFLPPSLNLPAHLSAHKYFFVCTLTVAAWDTLVLSPRTWRLLKTQEWPPLKIIFHILRVLMPAEFVIVAVAFFNTKFTQSMCQDFYLFEPIVTAVLLALCSAVHLIRVHAIYEKNTTILAGLSALLLAQVASMAVGIGFFRSVPLEEGQGCIAGPKHNWVGIYWVAPAVFYLTTFALAVTRSLQSLQVKPLGYWKLMLRDGLNLYGAIALVQLVNVLFWFIARPTDEKDTIKTIVTSMAAVLTTTMTLRIILSVRGSLAQGGAYAGTSSAGSGSRGTTHVISTRGAHGGVVNIAAPPSQQLSTPGNPGAYTLEEMRAKAEREWDGSSSHDGKEVPLDAAGPGVGVKIQIEREVDFRDGYGYKQ